jgi:hypothetical protein
MTSRSVRTAPGARARTAFKALPRTGSGTPTTGGFGYPRDSVEDVLDLLRADLLATCLDDVVLAPDEVEEALLIRPEEIAREEHLLPRERAWAERTCGRVRVLPVALHDVGPADHKFPDDARPCADAVFVDHIGLSAGDRDTDRAWSPRQLVRWQIGAALALSQPVHREKPRVRE